MKFRALDSECFATLADFAVKDVSKASWVSNALDSRSRSQGLWKRNLVSDVVGFLGFAFSAPIDLAAGTLERKSGFPEVVRFMGFELWQISQPRRTENKLVSESLEQKAFHSVRARRQSLENDSGLRAVGVRGLSTLTDLAVRFQDGKNNSVAESWDSKGVQLWQIC